MTAIMTATEPKLPEPRTFHWATRIVHWLSALTVFGLFGSGLWMVGLDYYHTWYQTAPNWHRSVGLILALATIVRLVLYVLPRPGAQVSHPQWQRRAALMLKLVMLMLLFTMFVSGYLISTATGDPIDVFGLVSVPSLIQFEHLEEYAGDVHEWSAWTLIALVGVHALAALKHHFIDRDTTLTRMTFGSR